ncbi:MAG: hypothetical protein FJY36_06905 [Betaproteobacteria bacterium]|nr:hypothetical protein [Betaproteobacteria bacterium]
MHKRMAMQVCLAWAAGLALPPTLAQTAPRRRGTARPPAPDKGPAETTPERDKRLLRECKGKPNAGACEGYAS